MFLQTLQSSCHCKTGWFLFIMTKSNYTFKKNGKKLHFSKKLTAKEVWEGSKKFNINLGLNNKQIYFFDIESKIYL